MEVAEQLETLSVAAEAAGPEGSCSVAEENVSTLSEVGQTAPQGRSGAGGAATEGHLQAGEAGPSAAVPAGGTVDGQIPGLLEVPATDSTPMNGSAFPRDCTWPRAVCVAGGDPGAGRGEKRSQDSPAPAEGEGLPGPEEGAPPPPLDLSGPSSSLGLAGGPGEGAAQVRLASPGPEGQGQGPGDVFALKKEPSVDEGGSASTESESDTDTDSSSSVSSTSSCSPVVFEEDDRQCKNDADSQSVGGKEVSEKSLPVEDLTIFLPESVELVPFGKVSSIVDNLVIVESLKGLPPVNEDSVLFKQDHYSIGKVFEVFGPVSHPFYALQFNSPEHIEAKGIKAHDDVYFAPSVESFTQYVFPEKMKQEKGSDASWKNDEEPPAEALDFSDDEKEKAAKQQKKSERRKKFRSQNESNENGNHYQPRGQHSSNYSRGSLRGGLNPSFSRGRFPRPPIPSYSFRQQARPPQHYCSEYTEFQKPSAFFQHPRRGHPGRQQCSFPPPSFGTVSNEAYRFPPPPPAWGWPQDCVRNTYDPLLALLSLPPPPPPPLPPASTAPPNNNNAR
ncbi:PREDICTED: H/ACA ribonucleoprotein complex non-core subunit NAF1 [Gekko japonicus]|uniref:H/ACA ribonucleoprotein complex non-core subunit NAF1 n=1 Tax=Gekko japonicus TaxID=146911 RepID=A0ABM1LF73_GEKJA|nr:PREDICTED: H/ACA ribonucleoprotein complex non-core subunit NAF1 [Gekko japonicus]